MQRRTLLAGAALVAVAGCLENDNGTTDDDDGSSGEDLPELAGTFDDFEDLSRWQILEGEVSADTDRSAVGTQSAVTTLSGTGEALSLSLSPDDPIDVTSVVPGLAVEGSRTTIPWIRLVDDSGSVATYRRAIAGGIPIQRVNFGVDTTEEAFDETTVSEIRVQILGGDTPLTAWMDDLHFVPRPATGKVMIQFDDCHETDYTKALPRLEDHDIPAATFVNPEYIERGTVAGDSRLSVEQCEALDAAGWTVANHTWSHERLPDLDRSGQREEILEGKHWLEDHGFEEGARYFAYPFGDHDATSVELVADHQDLSFHGGYPASGHTANTELAPRIGEPSSEEITDILDTTAEHGGITSIFYHRLEDEEQLADFTAMLDHLVPMLDNGDLEIVLPQDIEDRYLF